MIAQLISSGLTGKNAIGRSWSKLLSAKKLKMANQVTNPIAAINPNPIRYAGFISFFQNEYVRANIKVLTPVTTAIGMMSPQAINILPTFLLFSSYFK
jgi:hypothetical protein